MLLRLLLVGCLAVIVVSPTQFSVEVAPGVHVTPADPLVWIVFAMWAAVMLRRSGLKLIGNSLRLLSPLVLVFLLLAALSSVRATHRLSAYKDIFQFVEYFVAALLAFSICRDAALRRTAASVFLVVATVIVVIAQAQYWMPAVEAFDVRGTFGNCNVLGGYLSLVLPVMFGLVLFDRHLGRRLWLAAAILLGSTVVLSGGTVLALVVVFIVMAAVRGRRALYIVLPAVLLWLLVLLPALPRDNLDILYRSIACFTDDGTLNARYPEWQAAAVMALENPWLGVGIGNYQANVGIYFGMIPNAPVAARPDTQNLFLVLASSMGIPGMLAFAGMLIVFIRRAAYGFAAPGDPFERGLALGLAGALPAFAINAVWSPLLVRGIGIPLAFVMALATSCGGRRTGAAE